ncbi:MAG TPA: TPM domain-containing protein [Methylophilaceae bacterium]|nr:TPM domain-containing protein [Methylophilaceae bacterium]
MKKTSCSRFFRHLFSGPWRAGRHFSTTALQHIAEEIRLSELTHTGEIRFAVEASLHPFTILAGKTPRARALELFSTLNVWDTEHNNGILVYLLLADRDVEIVADRGIHQKVDAHTWEAICREMEAAFRRGEFESGTLMGIRQLGKVLQRYFPADGTNNNELPDAPLLL